MNRPVYTTQQLEKTATEVREDLMNMLVEAGSGHSAGPLGTAEIFTTLYLSVLNITPDTLDTPAWEDRDRFVLSAGHICPAYYVALAHAGFIDHAELRTLRKLGSRLQGHPHNEAIPALETSSGPLGQGLSQAIGMCLASRLDQKDYWVYCLMGDGEQQEGQIWEAVMFAGKEKIHNLTAIIDRNNIQIDGYTEEVMPLEPLREKYESFGWHVLDIDGHNVDAIIDACNEAKAVFEKPVLLIAHTVPGKGVDFMERDYTWHGSPPKDRAQADEALRSIRTLAGKIEVHDLD